jgi:hypothetical protein
VGLSTPWADPWCRRCRRWSPGCGRCRPRAARSQAGCRGGSPARGLEVSKRPARRRHPPRGHDLPHIDALLDPSSSKPRVCARRSCAFRAFSTTTTDAPELAMMPPHSAGRFDWWVGQSTPQAGCEVGLHPPARGRRSATDRQLGRVDGAGASARARSAIACPRQPPCHPPQCDTGSRRSAALARSKTSARGWRS